MLLKFSKTNPKCGKRFVLLLRERFEGDNRQNLGNAGNGVLQVYLHVLQMLQLARYKLEVLGHSFTPLVFAMR